MENMNNKNFTSSIIESNKIGVTTKSKIKRPRSLTTLKLEVVAERARKMKRIKEALSNEGYKVESKLIAESLMNNFSEDDLK